MSPIAWLCAFLLVGLVTTPTGGSSLERRDDDNDHHGFPQLLNVNQQEHEEEEEEEEEDHDDDKRQINKQVRHEIEHLNAMFQLFVEFGDEDGILSLYANDVTVMPDGYQAFQGSNILAGTLHWIHNVHSVEVQIQDLVPMSADAEYVLETKNYQVIGLDGSVQTDGKSVIIWKKYGHDYKIYLEIYNSNN